MSEYKKAGVDIALADQVKNKIKLLVASTRTPAVLADVLATIAAANDYPIGPKASAPGAAD